MTMDDPDILPEHPFFNCVEDGFAILDADQMKTGLLTGEVKPRFTLALGPGNIIQHRPRQVVDRDDTIIAIECDDEVTVYLDFDAGAARMRTPEGEFFYRGGIDEGNDAKGYIPAG